MVNQKGSNKTFDFKTNFQFIFLILIHIILALLIYIRNLFITKIECRSIGRISRNHLVCHSSEVRVVVCGGDSDGFERCNYDCLRRLCCHSFCVCAH